jgi:hypothetical protein
MGIGRNRAMREICRAILYQLSIHTLNTLHKGKKNKELEMLRVGERYEGLRMRKAWAGQAAEPVSLSVEKKGKECRRWK